MIHAVAVVTAGAVRSVDVVVMITVDTHAIVSRAVQNVPNWNVPTGYRIRRVLSVRRLFPPQYESLSLSLTPLSPRRVLICDVVDRRVWLI